MNGLLLEKEGNIVDLNKSLTSLFHQNVSEDNTYIAKAKKFIQHFGKREISSNNVSGQILRNFLFHIKNISKI
jgi:hypothetical protein